MDWTPAQNTLRLSLVKIALRHVSRGTDPRTLAIADNFGGHLRRSK